MPDHAYRIMAQRRVVTRRGREEFLVAAGAPSEMPGLYRSRSAARRVIMEMVNAPDWEHRNPHAAHYFYWAKRVDLTAPPA